MNTKVLSMLLGVDVQDPQKVIDQGYLGNSQFNAGCFIKASAVHSISSGTILAIDRDPKTSTWVVTVEVDSQHWIRYCCLSAVKVISGTKIKENDSIGYAYKNLMKLEYCTSIKSQFPVRILSRQLYKHDPTPILFGGGVNAQNK